jgi:TRAP-type C4-dicarboxylate transport system permease small subunit
VIYFERFVYILTKFCDRIAQAGVIAMLLLVFVNILGRMLWKPIFAAYDYVSFIGAVIVAFSIAYCGVKKGHIQVEMLVERFSPRGQGVIDSITGILSLGLFCVITWQCMVYGNDMRRSGELSMTALAPFYPYIYGIAFGCALLCLVILIDLIKSVTKVVKG